jgi:hypothetical protein
MFKAICKLGLEGIVSKKLNASYKSGPSKDVVENQKSESARRYSGCRWNVLDTFFGLDGSGPIWMQKSAWY